MHKIESSRSRGGMWSIDYVAGSAGRHSFDWSFWVIRGRGKREKGKWNDVWWLLPIHHFPSPGEGLECRRVITARSPGG